MSEERGVTIDAAGGLRLDGRLAMPARPRGGVVVCHPHPLYGGDMDNLVVVTAARAAVDSGLATLRFNFRGVGASGGRHEAGDGERHDVLAACAFLRNQLAASAPVVLAGYSFGAWVAAGAAELSDPAPLCLIAPPLAMLDLAPLPADSGRVLIVVGTRDVYCPLPAVERLGGSSDVEIVTIEGADHFFSGALEALGDAVARWARGGFGPGSEGPAREAGGRGGAG